MTRYAYSTNNGKSWDDLERDFLYLSREYRNAAASKDAGLRMLLRVCRPTNMDGTKKGLRPGDQTYIDSDTRLARINIETAVIEDATWATNESGEYAGGDVTSWTVNDDDDECWKIRECLEPRP